jgi:hypothetical protein
VVSPQGEIEQDGYPAGAAFAGRTGIATNSGLNTSFGESFDSPPEGEDDLFRESLFPEETSEVPTAKLSVQCRTIVQRGDKCKVRISARLTTKVRRISKHLNVIGKRGYF